MNDEIFIIIIILAWILKMFANSGNTRTVSAGSQKSSKAKLKATTMVTSTV